MKKRDSHYFHVKTGLTDFSCEQCVVLGGITLKKHRKDLKALGIGD